MPYTLTVAVSKGRLLPETAAAWSKSGWKWPKTERCFWLPPDQSSPGLIIARGADIPGLVQDGIAAFGIVGRDIIEEAHASVLDVLDLGFSACRMVLAGRDDKSPSGPVRVATKYPRIARQFFGDKGYAVELVKLSGSLELAPHIGLASYIVDIAQTGGTLRENRLQEIETIFESTARLIAHPATWRDSAEAQTIFQRLAASTKPEIVATAATSEGAP